jgi:DNA-binding PadR family transcriptional regulator
MPTRAALGAMLEDPGRPMYARDICEAADLAEGTIYTLLARLEKAGWLTSWMESIDESAEGRRARRYYQLSPDGVELARQALAEAHARSRRAARFSGGLRPAEGDA